ncbi:unnamed protein product [Brassica rapa]|uniref:KIB1-4 beta-propeller domain-containing protein n=2 Tax=Brassica TaxID=3705 RepID=A0A8D9HA73_BRACM|nr:unnamed protein product [Brassica napus]CAG7895938.1 unnamed protein product [Brassica rapa]
MDIFTSKKWFRQHSNWYLCSKQTLRPKFRSPLVILCPKEGGCRLYNPEKDMVYVAKSDLSGYQFLGNSPDEKAMNAYKAISAGYKIVVTTPGEVLFLYTRAYEPASGKPRIFRLYKRDAKDLDPGTLDTWLVKVDSIGDEALFFDLGITVPADHTLGIEPSSIYFTRNDRRFSHTKRLTTCIDVCVYKLATKTIKRVPGLSSNFRLKVAMWFLPS